MSLLDRPEDVITTGITTAVVMVVAAIKPGSFVETTHPTRAGHDGWSRRLELLRVDESEDTRVCRIALRFDQETNLEQQ